MDKNIKTKKYTKLTKRIVLNLKRQLHSKENKETEDGLQRLNTCKPPIGKEPISKNQKEFPHPQRKKEKLKGGQRI